MLDPATSSLSHPELFQPFDLGPLRLRNRIVMSPMTRNRAGEADVPTAQNALYYAQRAAAGLIVTEASQISEDGVGYPSTPGIFSPQQIDGWRRVVDLVHATGGRIFLQLWHVGRISHPSMQPGEAQPIAPSPIKPAGEAITTTGKQPFVTPRALEPTEIPKYVGNYAAGARNAQQAGFDGVEIHAANGYLIDQFLRDGSNQRDDEYGGTVENRCRFLAEVVDVVADVWGGDRVGVRLSPTSGFNDMRDSDPHATFVHAAKTIGERDLAYMHVIESGQDDDTLTLTRKMREAFDGATIVNEDYDAKRASQAVRDGHADLVAFGVPFLANPDLVTRIALDAPLNDANQATLYGGGAAGYTDYPTLTDVD